MIFDHLISTEIIKILRSKSQHSQLLLFFTFLKINYEIDTKMVAYYLLKNLSQKNIKIRQISLVFFQNKYNVS